LQTLGNEPLPPPPPPPPEDGGFSLDMDLPPPPPPPPKDEEGYSVPPPLPPKGRFIYHCTYVCSPYLRATFLNIRMSVFFASSCLVEINYLLCEMFGSLVLFHRLKKNIWVCFSIAFWQRPVSQTTNTPLHPTNQTTESGFEVEFARKPRLLKPAKPLPRAAHAFRAWQKFSWR